MTLTENGVPQNAEPETQKLKEKKMTGKLKLGKMAIVPAVFTFVLAMLLNACVTPGEAGNAKSAEVTDPALNGTWFYDDGSGFRFDNGNWEGLDSGNQMVIGTYTTGTGAEGNTITMTITGVHGDMLGSILGLELESRWHSRDEVEALVSSLPGVVLDDIFLRLIETYSVSGEPPTLSFSGNVATLKKQ